jgi:WD40 repeat protein
MEIACKLAEASSGSDDDTNELPPALAFLFVQAGPTPIICDINHDYSFWSRKFGEWDHRVILLSPKCQEQPIENLDELLCHEETDCLAPKLTLQGHTDCVNCATFSQDGKYIVSGGDDHTVRIWDAHTGNPTLGPLNIHTDAVFCVALSPDGRRIASGSGDHTIIVWDAAAGEAMMGPFEAHTKDIYCISFSPDGKRIASGSEDKTIQVCTVPVLRPTASKVLKT